MKDYGFELWAILMLLMLIYWKLASILYVVRHLVKS